MARSLLSPSAAISAAILGPHQKPRLPSSDAKLAPLHAGFRERSPSYDDLTRQVRAWAEAFPQIVQVTSLGTTPEGPAPWVSRDGRDRERSRPAAWIDGSTRAAALAGSSVALAGAEDAIRAHVTLGAELTLCLPAGAPRRARPSQRAP